MAPAGICIGNQTARAATSPDLPFEFALAHGFDAFEWFSDREADWGWCEELVDKAGRRRLREIGWKQGIAHSVHAPWHASPLLPEGRAQIRRSFDFASEVGGGLVNIHLFAEQGIGAFARALREPLERSVRSGISLSIENMPATGPDDFNRLFDALEARYGTAVRHVGMCLDIGHANLHPATRNDYLRFLDRLHPHVPIIHVHAHENWGDADSHLTLFTGPSAQDGAGVRGLIRRLVARSFSGSIILEQWPDPPELLVQARRRLKELLSEQQGST
jgi:sugar phosphate isomerase/epimerase